MRFARLRELVDQQLRTRPDDYNRIFGDLLALEGQYHWSAALEDFTHDFYTVSCLHCAAEVTIAVGDYGCYSAIRDWDLGDIERRALRPATAEERRDPGRSMHATAVRDEQQRLAEGIRHVFGRAECPACASMFSIAEAHTSAGWRGGTRLTAPRVCAPGRYRRREWPGPAAGQTRGRHAAPEPRDRVRPPQQLPHPPRAVLTRLPPGPVLPGLQPRRSRGLSTGAGG